LVEHDLPVTTLSKLLGHECLSTTQVYLTGADPQVRQDYAAAMADRLELSKGRDVAPRHLSEAEATSLERHLRAYLVHDTPEACRDAAWSLAAQRGAYRPPLERTGRPAPG
jgi:hypothetical protein